MSTYPTALTHGLEEYLRMMAEQGEQESLDQLVARAKQDLSAAEKPEPLPFPVERVR